MDFESEFVIIFLEGYRNEIGPRPTSQKDLNVIASIQLSLPWNIFSSRWTHYLYHIYINLATFWHS